MACTCCPYGPFLTLPAILCFIAWILTYTYAFGCDFFETVLRIGLWTVEDPYYRYGRYEYSGTNCYAWENYNLSGNLDGPMVAGRAFSMIAVILSLPMFVLILIPACAETGKCYFVVLAWICFFQGLMSILCLVALASDLCKAASSCTIGSAAIICIVTAVLWAVIGVILMLMPKQLKSDRRGAPTEPVVTGVAATATATTIPAAGQVEETVTRTENPDGTTTVKTTTTTTNADGSKTVTEKTEIEGPAGKRDDANGA